MKLLKKTELKKSDNKKLPNFKIVELTNKMVNNFTSLNSGSFQPDKNFIKDLKSYMTDNFMKGDIDNKNLITKKGFLRELRKQAIKQDIILSDFVNFQKKIKETERMLKFYLDSRLKKVKELRNAQNDLEEEIKLFQEEKKLRELEKKKEEEEEERRMKFSPESMRTEKKPHPVFLIAPQLLTPIVRTTPRRDPSNQVRPRSRRRSGIGSPIYVLQTRVSSLTKEVNNIEENIQENEKMLEEYKIKIEQCRSLLKKNILFLLRYPDFLDELGFKILKCIKNLMIIGEVAHIDQIGGKFFDCEKEYLIKFCKIQLKWVEMKKFNDKLSKLKRNQESDINKGFSRSKTYGAPIIFKVRLIHDDKIEKKLY